MIFQTQPPTQTNLNVKFLLEEIKILTQEEARFARDNKELATRILELEEKLKTNSSNSSKPHSQDPFRSTKKWTLSNTIGHGHEISNSLNSYMDPSNGRDEITIKNNKRASNEESEEYR